MSKTQDKGELLIIANLAEQAERYDGKWACVRFVSPAASSRLQSGITNCLRQIDTISDCFHPIRKQREH